MCVSLGIRNVIYNLKFSVLFIHVYMCHTAICSAHMVISNGNLLALRSRIVTHACLFYAQFTILIIIDIKLILIFG